MNNAERADDKWKEAPGYCVECSAGVPISSAGICEECYRKSLLSPYKEWEGRLIEGKDK